MSDSMWTVETRPAGIPVQCFTNLDDYNACEWPKQMSCRPAVGDRVEAKGGRTLKVIGITHAAYRDGVPYLKVELHK